MTRVTLEQLSPEHQAFIRKHAHVGEEFKKPRTPKPTWRGIEFDTALEVQFAQEELEPKQLAGFIQEWAYHPIKVRLALNCTYEPDFWAWRSDTDVTIYEVKGSWLAKNARDSRTRLSIAASMYWRWQWRGVTRDGKTWIYESFGPEGTPME